MQCRIIFLAIVYRIHKSRIFKKCPVLDFLCNPCQFLIYNAPCAHIQMPYLGISHLSLRKAYRHAAGIAFHKRTFLHQPIHYRRIRFRHGIPVFPFIQPIAIQNHQYCRFLTHFALSFDFLYIFRRRQARVYPTHSKPPCMYSVNYFPTAIIHVFSEKVNI